MSAGEILAAVRELLRASSGKLLLLFCGVLIPLVVFGLLAEDVWRREGLSFDVPVLLAAHRLESRAGDTMAIVFTILGAAPCMVAFTTLLLALMWRRRRRRDLVFVIVSLGGAAALNVLVKSVFQRSRPMLWPSPAPEFSYGFPSGHAMASMALALTVVALAWHTRWRAATIAVAVLWVLAVSGSRLYLGVHYPSDVLGAWAASVLWVTGSHAIVYKAADRLSHDTPVDDRPTDSETTRSTP